MTAITEAMVEAGYAAFGDAYFSTMSHKLAIEAALHAVAPLIARAVKEQAAKVAREHFIGIFTGWAADDLPSLITLDQAEEVASECADICVAAIRGMPEEG